LFFSCFFFFSFFSCFWVFSSLILFLFFASLFFLFLLFLFLLFCFCASRSFFTALFFSCAGFLKKIKNKKNKKKIKKTKKIKKGNGVGRTRCFGDRPVHRWVRVRCVRVRA
jgi:predicted membrane protein